MVKVLSLLTTRVLIALFLCFLIGVTAGLVGVGGGEHRMPVLLYLLRLPVVTAITANLLIGFLTVLTSFFRRFQLGLLDGRALDIALTMSVGSILGAYLGALITGKISEKILKRFLAVFLIIVGFKMLLEPVLNIPIPSIHLTKALEVMLAILFAILIGVISGILGVAGGEFRIPILIYVFNFDVVIAGTTSLLVSIPTTATGFFKHNMMRHTSKNVIILAVVMGISSVTGALIGSTYVVIISKEILKMMLGIILLLASMRMVTKP